MGYSMTNSGGKLKGREKRVGGEGAKKNPKRLVGIMKQKRLYTTRKAPYKKGRFKSVDKEKVKKAESLEGAQNLGEK